MRGSDEEESEPAGVSEVRASDEEEESEPPGVSEEPLSVEQSELQAGEGSQAFAGDATSISGTSTSGVGEGEAEEEEEEEEEVLEEGLESALQRRFHSVFYFFCFSSLRVCGKDGDLSTYTHTSVCVCVCVCVCVRESLMLDNVSTV